MKRVLPDWIEPMKATLTTNYFWDRGWIYEDKLDGERILARKQAGQVTLYSRNKIMQNDIYPEIVEELLKNKGDWWIDGEIVALKSGVGSFKTLQKRMHKVGAKDISVVYYVFDIMHLDHEDLRNDDFIERRKILHENIKESNVIKFVKEIKNPKQYLESALRYNREGMIVKNPTSSYQPKRSTDWLKFKASREQEFVILGYTNPQGLRQFFGSILIGFYDNGQLRYAGKVGTGFDSETLKELFEMFEDLKTKEPATADEIHEKSAHYIKPQLVCEVGFTEWTDDNKLRHPRYLGLRHDKIAKEVIKEQ